MSRSSYLTLPLLQVGTGEKRKVMGVLDIYGFEILEVRERQATSVSCIASLGGGSRWVREEDLK